MVSGTATMCGTCPCGIINGGHGPLQTEFNYGDPIYCHLEWTGNLESTNIRYKWIHEGETIRDFTYMIIESYSTYGFCSCPETWGYDPATNPIPSGNGYIEMYWREAMWDPWQLVATSDTYTILAPSLCGWVTDKGGPNNLLITDVFEIMDSYLFNTTPSGYDFIPTLQNVFGVIDYYLGFNGDSGTGCNFY